MQQAAWESSWFANRLIFSKKRNHIMTHRLFRYSELFLRSLQWNIQAADLC